MTNIVAQKLTICHIVRIDGVLQEAQSWHNLTARILRATKECVYEGRGVTMKQNITLSLEKTVIRNAKVLAAEKSLSVSALLAQELTRLVKQDHEYKLARLSAIDDLEQGLQLGGKPLNREALYDR